MKAWVSRSTSSRHRLQKAHPASCHSTSTESFSQPAPNKADACICSTFLRLEESEDALRLRYQAPFHRDCQQCEALTTCYRGLSVPSTGFKTCSAGLSGPR